MSSCPQSVHPSPVSTLAAASPGPASALPSPVSPLAALLERSDIWTGDRLAPATDTLPSGHPALDAVLPGGGWPRGGLVDVMFPRAGIGELSLLLPVLRSLTTQDEWVLLQAPAWRPFAPAWQAAGVRLSRLIVVEAAVGHPRLAASDTLWAAEQILRAGSVAAALFWLPRSTGTAALRRLQVAAEAGGTLSFLMQDEARLAQPSPAPLRLRLEAGEEGLRVHLVKRRGAPLTRPVVIAPPAMAAPMATPLSAAPFADPATVDASRSLDAVPGPDAHALARPRFPHAAA